MKNFNSGPIIYVEDDMDDRIIFKEILSQIGVTNELLFFDNGKEFLNFLYKAEVQPLLIVSDINMPVMNGIELRKNIVEDDRLMEKSIPFIFFTTSINTKEIKLAYNLTVQGYFKKPTDIAEMKANLKMIIDYWCICKHPNMS